MNPDYTDYEDMEAESRLFPWLDCEFDHETTDIDFPTDNDFYEDFGG